MRYTHCARSERGYPSRLVNAGSRAHSGAANAHTSDETTTNRRAHFETFPSIQTSCRDRMRSVRFVPEPARTARDRDRSRGRPDESERFLRRTTRPCDARCAPRCMANPISRRSPILCRGAEPDNDEIDRRNRMKVVFRCCWSIMLRIKLGQHRARSASMMFRIARTPKRRPAFAGLRAPHIEQNA